MAKWIVVGCLFAGLAACSGDGGPPPPVGNLSIQTQGLNNGNVGHSYFQQMSAIGGRGPYTWWVSTSGDPLPGGLAMQSSGLLAGTPTQSASASVVLVCQDVNASLDLVTLNLEIRDVEINGGTSQNLILGQQLSLSATGGTPSYTFSFTVNQSGAALSQQGDYTAGNGDGVDVVRATDNDGFYEEISLTVGSNPFVGFKAEWGVSDVWWINFDVVYDPSPTYASDFDETLVALGLRDPASTTSAGTEADQWARQLVQRRILSHISTYFGNSPDGGLLPGGLAISFPAPQAPNPGTSPAPGGTTAPGGTAYNTMCVRYGPTANVVGTAWLDPGNDSIEHDCGNPQNTPLGVFANRILNPYLQSYNNSIASNPVHAGDVAGLQAMLLGAAPSSAREQAIWNVADGFARVVAAVLAHEIGHSLGLNHAGSNGAPSSIGQGDIMNASLSVGPGIAYMFSPGHWATLLSSLPGPNR